MVLMAATYAPFRLHLGGQRPVTNLTHKPPNSSRSTIVWLPRKRTTPHQDPTSRQETTLSATKSSLSISPHPRQYGVLSHLFAAQVSTSGTGVPDPSRLVSLPGAYSDNDPGNFHSQVFDAISPYTFPGPPVPAFMSGGTCTPGNAIPHLQRQRQPRPVAPLGRRRASLALCRSFHGLRDGSQCHPPTPDTSAGSCVDLKRLWLRHPTIHDMHACDYDCCLDPALLYSYPVTHIIGCIVHCYHGNIIRPLVNLVSRS
ncbi:uncharacterized protein LACBIDRAFT_308609 [Laccaria bicolor S238N-H82]|uniref:Predicted protein n=1 Tax=Laccaria bicolor (strain S238N-H82 / ATCC MYA-4686) TaxID=486041 RepID=B0CWS0_LACBS|nr:uncharacterized protein LACBIDRAFT_308609 [Laccaria bicolor S238N-H82]EDR13120.1 predicted protein [Laccaria bicolor S238N-H82]|eukprot:XP_001875618.1 predicted protein [Laccaria bicolor S238N-H82]